MSRISALELQYTDLEWYGVDRKGNIAVFLSAGDGNVPEFVCCDKERAEALIGFFEAAEGGRGCRICLPLSGSADALAREMAGRGLFCFDSDDHSNTDRCNLRRFYTKISGPLEPLTAADLPEYIRGLLMPNRMELADFSADTVLYVEHAYP